MMMKGLAVFIKWISPLIVWGSTLGASEPKTEPYPQVYRSFLPDAGPSAFAVKLGGNLVLLYDPLQGGIQKAMTGQLDLSPTLRAKINEPARLEGKVFYRETIVHPLKAAQSKEASFKKFLGYQYEANQVRFRYSYDGVKIDEILALSPSGQGFTRTWNYPTQIELVFQLEAQPSAQVTLPDGTPLHAGAISLPRAGQFTINIDPSPSR